MPAKNTSRTGAVSFGLGESISVVEEEQVEIKDALLLVGFPTVGLVSSIVANHVIRQLKLRRIGHVSSRYFFPSSVVIDGVPNPPVRIYAGEHICGPGRQCQQVLVVASEFLIQPDIIDPTSEAIIEWARKRKVRTVVTVEGVNVEDSRNESDPAVVGVGSTIDARHSLKELGVQLMSDGMVGGVSGALLYKGSIRRLPVISLLVEAPANYPGARSAAKAIEILDRMLPLIKLDPQPLYQKAREIEQSIMEAMSRAAPRKELGSGDHPPGYM
ncbi:MAG: PAC2 family protein [Methanomassiliicoccales archaeon]